MSLQVDRFTLPPSDNGGYPRVPEPPPRRLCEHLRGWVLAPGLAYLGGAARTTSLDFLHALRLRCSALYRYDATAYWS